jgi:NAD(P)-dependent dehydrogenase (short-subunit alcohol dehydrogenase family)
MRQLTESGECGEMATTGGYANARAATLRVMDLQLRGKKAIVTGGSRGIGKAIARELAAEGVDVALTARSVEPLQEAARELAEESGARVLAVACDTGADESVRAMVAEAVAALGGLDLLVNAAAQPGGQAPPPKLAEVTDDVFWPDVNVKVLGYLRCIREAAPHLAQNGGGRVINISGLAARSTGSTVGSMRNVAVSAMTKNLADELAPQGIGIVVVHPGLTRTERTPDVQRAQADAQGVDPSVIEERMGRSNLLGRLVDAQEVAQVAAFLASPKAAAINGDAVCVGGGVRGSIFY